MKSLNFITVAFIATCQFIWPLTAHAQNREYFCAATEAMLLDFLSIPKRPLYMQRVNTDGFNIKLSRYENKIIMPNNRGQETTYPMLKLGYSYTNVKDFSSQPRAKRILNSKMV